MVQQVEPVCNNGVPYQSTGLQLVALLSPWIFANTHGKAAEESPTTHARRSEKGLGFWQ